MHVFISKTTNNQHTFMKFKAILFSLALATATLSSCGKYDEGPGLSFRSKKARIANTWVIEGETVNGKETSAADLQAEINASDTPMEIEITKDGDVTNKYKDGSTNKIKWELLDGKEKIKFSTTTSGITVSYEEKILKLKEKSMWLEYENTFGGTTTKTVTKYKEK